MGRLQIVLSEDIDKKFRHSLGKNQGLKKGMISREIERLIQQDLKEIPTIKKSGLININPNENILRVIKSGAQIENISEEDFVIKILNFICLEKPELLGLEL